MDRMDKIFSEISAEAEKEVNRDNCISAEDMSILLSNGFTGERRDSLLRHIATCPRCSDAYKLASELSEKRPRFNLKTAGLAASVILVIASVYMIKEYPEDETLRFKEIPAESVKTDREQIKPKAQIAAKSQSRKKKPGKKDLKTAVQPEVIQLQEEEAAQPVKKRAVPPPAAKRRAVKEKKAKLISPQETWKSFTEKSEKREVGAAAGLNRKRIGESRVTQASPAVQKTEQLLVADQGDEFIDVYKKIVIIDQKLYTGLSDQRMTKQLVGNTCYLIPDTDYFLKQSRGGSTHWKFFILANKGWAMPGRDFLFNISSETPAEKDRLIQRWKKLIPYLQGKYREIANQTILVLINLKKSEKI